LCITDRSPSVTPLLHCELSEIWQIESLIK
jgi:hypothetical protein